MNNNLKNVFATLDNGAKKKIIKQIRSMIHEIDRKQEEANAMSYLIDYGEFSGGCAPDYSPIIKKFNIDSDFLADMIAFCIMNYEKFHDKFKFHNPVFKRNMFVSCYYDLNPWYHIYVDMTSLSEAL